jgi:uncharacterized membrane protein YebE (DUF533 family)
MEDQHALLLIRAMIGAANADGEITPDERRHILDTLDQAGAGPFERPIVEQELDRPQPLESRLQFVKDQQTAEQVYLASRMAVNEQSEAERSYLHYLASRLSTRSASSRSIRQPKGGLMDGQSGRSLGSIASPFRSA